MVFAAVELRIQQRESLALRLVVVHSSALWPAKQQWEGLTCRHGNSMIIGAQTEEQEQRDEPDAEAKEGCNLCEARRFFDDNAVCPEPPGFIRDPGKVEEPEEMVCNDP